MTKVADKIKRALKLDGKAIVKGDTCTFHIQAADGIYGMPDNDIKPRLRLDISDSGRTARLFIDQIDNDYRLTRSAFAYKSALDERVVPDLAEIANLAADLIDDLDLFADMKEGGQLTDDVASEIQETVEECDWIEHQAQIWDAEEWIAEWTWSELCKQHKVAENDDAAVIMLIDELLAEAENEGVYIVYHEAGLMNALREKRDEWAEGEVKITDANPPTDTDAETADTVAAKAIVLDEIGNKLILKAWTVKNFINGYEINEQDFKPFVDAFDGDRAKAIDAVKMGRSVFIKSDDPKEDVIQYLVDSEIAGSKREALLMVKIGFARWIEYDWIVGDGRAALVFLDGNVSWPE